MDIEEFIRQIKGIFDIRSNDRYSFAIYSKKIEPRDFMIIMQNPGDPDKDEIKAIKKSESDLEAIEENIKAMKKWIENKKNKEFWDSFISNLNKIQELQDLKKDNILDYFHITDLIKKRAYTHKVDEKKGYEESVEDILKNQAKRKESYELLENEIKEVNPKLIFAISTRTWDNLKEIYKDKIIAVKNNKLNCKVTRAHGYLFKVGKEGPYIIPLAHFSGQNNFLRDSYFKYLKEGINRFIKETAGD